MFYSSFPCCIDLGRQSNLCTLSLKWDKVLLPKSSEDFFVPLTEKCWSKVSPKSGGICLLEEQATPRVFLQYPCAWPAMSCCSYEVLTLDICGYLCIWTWGVSSFCWLHSPAQCHADALWVAPEGRSKTCLMKKKDHNKKNQSNEIYTRDTCLKSLSLNTFKSLRAHFAINLSNGFRC